MTSEAGAGIVFTHYKTIHGQRWTVASYPSSEQLPDAMVGVRVSVDETETLSRETEARDGDFMLPFATFEEITAHEERVNTGEVMRIAVGDTDTIHIDLADFRAALKAVEACLQVP